MVRRVNRPYRRIGHESDGEQSCTPIHRIGVDEGCRVDGSWLYLWTRRDNTNRSSDHVDKHSDYRHAGEHGCAIKCVM